MAKKMNSDFVKKLIEGDMIVKNSDSYTRYKFDDLTKIQKAYSKRDFLTVSQTGMWLGKSVPTVYRMIKDGRIIATRPNNTGKYLIDVEATKELLFHSRCRKYDF